MAHRITRRHLLIASSGIALVRPAIAQPVKPRLARKDSFFGMHFDLHPNEKDKELGKDLTGEMVERFLDKVQPDYVQYDSKGHAGWLGFPSKVGESSPGIVKDSLAIWRKVTARRGVALYIHFSGVWDSLAVKRRPEWARVNEKGEPDPNQTSTFGPYVDKLMIPQLQEVATNYDLDGAWVDGECWATRPDYAEGIVKQFLKSSGLRSVPKDEKDEGWNEWLDFNREQFRRYLRHYLEVMHKSHPKFQIASNWMYTTYVPEKPDIPVDYISGDYLGNASISSARLESRYLSSVGKPWDLMAWGFQRGLDNPVGNIHKPAVQLEQESSVVLAQGGGFQIYYQPTRAGRLNDGHIEVMAQLGRFCRARQAISHKSETWPQIGVLFSRHSLYMNAPRLFGGWGRRVSAARGVVDALVEAHYPVDVIPDWKLKDVVSSYGLIVVPDWEDIGDEAAGLLTAYVQKGGKALLIGAENAAMFQEPLGIRLLGAPADQSAYVKGTALLANVRGVWQNMEAAGAAVIEQRYKTYDTGRDSSAAAAVRTFGKGTLAVVPGSIGKIFAATHAPATREFLARVVERLYARVLTLEAPPTVEAVLRKKGGKTILHLLNSTGMQVASDYAALDFIPPIGPIGVRIRLPAQPGSVTLEPGAKAIAGAWNAGEWSGTIDRLEVHSALVFG